MHRLGKMIRLSVLYATTLVLVAGYPLTTMAEGTDTATPTVVQTTTPTTTPDTTTTVDPTTASTSSSTSSPQAEPAPITDSAATPTTPAVTPSTEAQTTTPVPSLEPTVVTPAPTTTTPTTTSTSKTDTAVDARTAATITNALDSSATTGDATAKYNTTVGDTTSGDATAATTIINNVNSTLSNTDNQKAASFVTNVMGDVNGDVVLQPILLKAMLEGNQATTDKTINVTNTNTLTNNVNLSATSGDATALGNTQAGNATSGSATTVANVMNIVNSMVAANQSFVGTVNIYGNLNGDILIAPDFIPQLLASNAGAPALSQPSSSTTVVNANDTQSIVNNVSLAAASGKADLLQNTTAGNATTGDAKTNIVIFNLSGHAIVASNSLLVFVNVLGQWVGVIVDAPAGATAAAIGNGVTSNTTTAPDLVITANNTTTITNNITLNSQSGDASLIRNTAAGNATSGNASASANIANITGSQLGLSGWFGVLFINVFGTWHGSFGLDTAYGNPISSDTIDRITNKPAQVIAFRPHVSLVKTFIPVQPAALVVVTGTPSGSITSNTAQPTVLAATAEAPRQTMVPTPSPITPPFDMRLPIVAGALGLIGLLYVGLRRVLHS